jgi:hypothetical protein
LLHNLNLYTQLDLNITVTDNAPINNAIDELLMKLALSNLNQRIAHHHLKIILLNLYKNYYTNRKMYTGFHQNKNRYRTESRYNKNKVSHKITKLIKPLKDKLYIDFHNGFNSKNAWIPSRTSRIKATRKLIILMNKHKINQHHIEKLPNTESIIVQVNDGSKKTKLEYKDTPKIKKIREDIINYNNLLRHTHIDIDTTTTNEVLFGKSESPVAITENNKFIRRIYNDAKFKSGGRYYGGWYQGLNSTWRNKITIERMPTIEVDFSANGINILYAKEGLSIIEDDAYDVSTEGYKHKKYTKEQLRPLLKLMLLIMINAKNYKQAFEAMRGDMNDTSKQLPRLDKTEQGYLMKVFEQKHKAIKKYFYSGFGANLYLYDSTVAEGVINHFTAKDIAVLCIHDSFIINLKYLDELKKVMQDCFKKTMLSKTAPNVNTNDFLKITMPINPTDRNTGLFGLLPKVLKENQFVQVSLGADKFNVKWNKDRKEANERYIEFKDRILRTNKNYYNQS